MYLEKINVIDDTDIEVITRRIMIEVSGVSESQMLKVVKLVLFHSIDHINNSVSSIVNSRIEEYEIDIKHTEEENDELRSLISSLEAEKYELEDETYTLKEEIVKLEVELNNLQSKLDNIKDIM